MIFTRYLKFVDWKLDILFSTFNDNDLYYMSRMRSSFFFYIWREAEINDFF